MVKRYEPLLIEGSKDLFDPAFRMHCEQQVREFYARESLIVVWPPTLGPTSDGRDHEVEIVDLRPCSQEVPVEGKLTADAVERIEHLAAAQGLQLVAVGGPRNVATAAKLDARLPDLRKRFSEAMSCETWEFELAITAPESHTPTVIVTRAPKRDFDEKRVERWTQRAIKYLPKKRGTKWVVSEDHSNGRLYMRRITDRLQETQPYPWDAPVSMNALPFGIREDGSPVTLKLLEMNMLVGGTPGGGKSGGLTALMCGIARLENVAMIGVDPKQVEQAEWEPRFSRIALPDDKAMDEHHETTDVLGRVMEEMERRYTAIRKTPGRKKLEVSDFTRECPLLVLIVDEMAEVVASALGRDEKASEDARKTMLRRLVSKGRAAGIVLIAATQKPGSDVIPTNIRDNVQLRIAYATTNADMTDTILGKGASQNGGEPHKISADERGVCYVIAEGQRDSFRMRTYWVPDDEIGRIAQDTAHLRVDLPWLNAAGPPPRTAWPEDDDVSESDSITEHTVTFTMDEIRSMTAQADTEADVPDQGTDFRPAPPRPKSVWD